MPSITWIGKDQIVNHDKEVPFRLLKKIPSASIGKRSKNLIIEGDNLEALKALMPYYQGKIKCIYIDPPYNTGKEKWVYNDNVNAPKIKQWLGKVVGSEAEDLCRHDKWLCMMYPRLNLLKQLLSKDGAIFVSIDDNEQHHLRCIMDEIFGPENFVTNVIWQKKFSPQSDAKYFSDNHDFILVYAKNKTNGQGWVRNLLPRTEKMLKRYKNPDNDPRGPWMSGGLDVKTYNAKYDYPIKAPSGRVVKPPRGACWRVSKKRFEELVKDNRIWFGEKGNNVPRLKRFLSEVQKGSVPVTIWLHQEVGHNQEAKQELKKLFPDEKFPFQTPKPVRLIKRVLQIATNKDGIVLDSFAGSGTTGHAVLEINKKDKGNRKFILIELEKNIADKFTAERIRQVIKNEDFNEGFEFCRLDEPLFDELGHINESCTFTQLAQYIYFTETQSNLEEKDIKGNYIGSSGITDYYLIFTKKGANILNKAFLKKLPKDNRKKVIYADKCLVDDETLEEHGTQFKQIPYEVKVY